jgi:ATP-dependent protease ClpP protease subunit
MPADQRRLKSYPPPGASRRGSRTSDRAGDWEIAIFGDLTDKESEIMGQLVDVPRNSRGTIFFDSCGGSAYVGLALASLIRLRGLEAAAVVAGECSSAALLPFAACSHRYVTPHCTMLFHPIRWQSEEDIRLEEAAEWARHFKFLEEDLDRLMARLFGCPPETLEQWNRPGRFVSGQELVTAGLAQMIDLFAGDVWSQMKRTPQNV